MLSSFNLYFQQTHPHYVTSTIKRQTPKGHHQAFSNPGTSVLLRRVSIDAGVTVSPYPSRVTESISTKEPPHVQFTPTRTTC